MRDKFVAIQGLANKSLKAVSEAPIALMWRQPPKPGASAGRNLSQGHNK
jgi:hypothetical protein